MRSKNLVVALLVVLALAVSGFTYAFWSAGVAADTESKTGTITVGTGEQVISTVNVSAAVNDQGADALVPAGFAASGKITELTLTFTVSWASTGLDASGLTSELTVALVSATNPSSTSVLSLFNASFDETTYTIVSDGANVIVTATITMNEPANQAAYNTVAGLAITLGFSFSVPASNTAA